MIFCWKRFEPPWALALVSMLVQSLTLAKNRCTTQMLAEQMILEGGRIVTVEVAICECPELVSTTAGSIVENIRSHGDTFLEGIRRNSDCRRIPLAKYVHGWCRHRVNWTECYFCKAREHTTEISVAIKWNNEDTCTNYRYWKIITLERRDQTRTEQVPCTNYKHVTFSVLA